MEYFIRAPFIEISEITKAIGDFLKNSKTNGSMVIFYGMVVFTIFIMHTINNVGLIFLLVADILSFLNALAGLPDWKEYYHNRYFRK